MSVSQTAWAVLWDHAANGPFEISEVSPTVAKALNISEKDASKLIGGLLTELGRLPDGERFFAQEGNAVVPLPAFTKAKAGGLQAAGLYPFEL